MEWPTAQLWHDPARAMPNVIQVQFGSYQGVVVQPPGATTRHQDKLCCAVLLVTNAVICASDTPWPNLSHLLPKSSTRIIQHELWPEMKILASQSSQVAVNSDPKVRPVELSRTAAGCVTQDLPLSWDASQGRFLKN